ncbi:MAG: SEC-C domain-containing protein, partial [Deltaproteobacteria bacterium]|nr:SEC-C domain-containing protein [Deltaproteobacteria bacterium]
VIIVDEFTGRLMPGRRWSDGLHQAVEAKEGVQIANENQTLASVTFQNYFRMYQKLAGMTGTADTEAPEFHNIYKLEVIIVPTHRPMIRMDHPDVVYRTEEEKFRAAILGIEELHAKGQPILVGTISIEKSEKLSHMLHRKGIKHHVLNAKHHEKEAEIVAQAGRKGAVTISTNMAGRGTDIVLGGNPDMLLKHQIKEETPPEEVAAKLAALREQCKQEREEVVAAGGLHILGTERHEARRIDNQLRGRSGRQGDPGSSRFYLSLEDDLMRIFGSERISGLMQRLGMEEDIPIEHKLVTRAIENAQKKVEARNFEIRKHLLEYDDVMNRQRETIYKQRREILTSESAKETVAEKINAVTEDLLALCVNAKTRPEDWDLKELQEHCFKTFNLHLDFPPIESAKDPVDPLRSYIHEKVLAFYEEREKQVGVEILRRLERIILLQTIDAQWKDHLYVMDHLKEGIGLRGYGQRNPLQEYKKEAFEIFIDMTARVDSEALEKLFKVQVAKQSQAQTFEPIRRAPLMMNRGAPAAAQQPKTVQREAKKVGRNEPCPCGSGKKYKKCHGSAIGVA